MIEFRKFNCFHLPNNEHVRRALEVAITGWHSILIFSPIQLMEDFNEIANAFWNISKIKAIKYCPCGNYKSKVKSCRCQVSLIHTYYNKIDFSKWDIVVGAVETNAKGFTSNYTVEPYEKIKERIEKSRKFGEDKKFIVSNGAYEFIEYTVKKFELHPMSIVSLARTIANMDFSEIIKTQHISEAVLYKTYKELE